MKFFFVTFLNFLVGVANIFLTPVNTLLTNVFPDLSANITHFTNLVTTYFGTGLSFFFHLLPPNTRQLILLYLTLLIICYTITISLHVILKVIELLRHIKIW